MEKLKRQHVHWFSLNFLGFLLIFCSPLELTGRIPLLSCHQTPRWGHQTPHPRGLGIFGPSKSFRSRSPFMQLGNMDCISSSAWWIFKWVSCSLGNQSNYYILVYKKNMKTNGAITIIFQRARPARALQRRAGFVCRRELLTSYSYQK